MNSTRSSSNDQMMQQSMGDPSISGRPPDAMNSNSQLQPPPNTTLSMSPFPNLGGGLGDQQLQGPPGGPPPPPRCQIVNPFLGTPPLVPHDRMQQATAGGSSLGQQMENTFGQDIRHRGYPGVLGLPPPFQVHPNLQSQIQAFQQDMGQHGHMTQPPGFLQGFIPTEIVSTVPDSRTSHLLQPHVRQRARRRSRASRAASIQHVHEATVAATAGGGGGGGVDAASAAALGRSREMPPAAQITVDSAFGDSAAAGAARLEDAKLKGLEENYCSIGENFECNICFQKANEAVVTCCGHLFCWPCLYRWLHIHSYHKECPVCKGAIDESTITPIYGRECNALLSARGLPGGSAAERIPPRPPARRVESARQLREREDRGREREQRERAVEREREREREQSISESRSLAEALGQGVVTALIEEAAGGGGGMRDSASSAIQSVLGQAGGGGGGGGEITISSSSGRQQQQYQQQEEIDSRGGHEDPTNSSGGGSMSGQPTGPPGVNTASSFQDPSSTGGVGQRGGSSPSTLQNQSQGLMHNAATAGAADSTTATTTTAGTTTTTGSTPPFLQRRVSDRREQLRAALAASARSGVNSISSLADRVDERRQMIAAAALLSQEWEDIVNISRLVGPVNPVQAAAWMAAVQGRLGSEGTSLDAMGGDFPTHQGPGVMLHGQAAHRSNAGSRHMIASPAMISHDGGSGGDDSALSRLVTVNPLQAGDWLAAMRTRLTSMEKIVENLESPLQILQQHAPAVGASLHLNSAHAQSSPSHSMYAQGGGQLQTTAATSPGLEDLSLLDVIQQPSSVSNSTTSMEGPSARAVEERAAAAMEAAPLPSAAAARPASSSSTSASTPVHGNLRTQSEPRLHYREAPVPKPPSSSRRRSLRTGEEGTSMNNNQGQADATAEGSGCTGPPETMSSRSKRRRMD